MKKLFLSLFVIITFGAYALSQRRTDVVVSTSPLSTPLQTTTNPSTSTPGMSEQVPSQTMSPAPTSSKTGQYKDGSYTGDSVDAFYGSIQVKAVVKNGKLTDVQFLDYPQDRNTSRNINSQAMPILTSEAIKAQSSQIDAVSGATFTSQAFVQSLASALSQAKV